ncbi:AAA family ATPase [Streptococcus suis]|nr:AAA family ATPase [Streptococcus suis]
MSIKLRELTIKHLKNVDYGNIKFWDNNGFVNVLGIYGQNGSGKTTVVDAMEIIKQLIAGRPIPDNSLGIFNTDNEKNELPSILIEIEDEDNLVLRYKVEFISNESTNEQTVFVAKEAILYKSLKPYERFKSLYEFSILNILDNPEQNAGMLKSRTKILSNDAIEFLTNSSMREYSSYLFSKNFTTRIERSEGNLTEKEVISIFKKFGEHIRIYTQQSANMIGMGTMPININYQDGDYGFQGTLPAILSKGGFPVPREIIPIYEETVKYMNEIIPTIIPDLTIEMNISDTSTNQNGTQLDTVHFFANRNGKVFSLIHESEGIKKIISMIGVIVGVFNQPDTVAVIDELDSGIFEYLLGELIEIFSKDTQGQLIFTSHNLRVLEMLPTRQIRFSTTNPDNRYITLKGIKTTNNLRDVYLRSILLGGADEELYSGKSQSKIRRSLRKAGRYIGE